MGVSIPSSNTADLTIDLNMAPTACAPFCLVLARAASLYSSWRTNYFLSCFKMIYIYDFIILMIKVNAIYKCEEAKVLLLGSSSFIYYQLTGKLLEF